MAVLGLRTDAVRETIVARDGACCFWCDMPTVPFRGQFSRRTRPDQRTVDHFVCRSAGGTDDLENLVIACRRCNQMRGAMEPDAWLAVVASMELVAAEVAVAALLNVGGVA